MVLFAATSGYLLLAGVVLLTVSLLVRARRRLARSLRSDSAPLVRIARPDDDGPRHVALPKDLARWEVEMHERARAYRAELDSKMGALQHLIRAAEAERQHLESLLHEVGDGASDGAGLDDGGVARQRDAIGNHSIVDRGEATGAEPAEADAIHAEEVYAMADSGMDPREIALRLGNPVGTVALILSRRES